VAAEAEAGEKPARTAGRRTISCSRYRARSSSTSSSRISNCRTWSAPSSHGSPNTRRGAPASAPTACPPTSTSCARCAAHSAAGWRSVPYHARLRELQRELDETFDEHGEDSEEAGALRIEIGRLRAKIDNIPFIDSFDLRYNNRIREPRPTTQAVMFCLMDVSGSMDEERKATAKRFFMLLHLFLTRTYEHIELVFIRHHTVAEETDEDEFFHSRESGGTVVSSALSLMRDIVRERYAGGQWNIYGAQASDGDNWHNDSPISRQLLDGEILPACQYFAYIEITDGEPQNLWQEYEVLAAAHRNFAMQHIKSPADIYPVFRELFKKSIS
jgi:uncharacterized sporulation protein YeaH/YhbH (DUF444 family)